LIRDKNRKVFNSFEVYDFLKGLIMVDVITDFEDVPGLFGYFIPVVYPAPHNPDQIFS
jgi:hypothetical protein